MIKRRWLIYRDENKKEIAAVNDVMDFVAIVTELRQIIKDKNIDVADIDAMTDAIERSLPDNISWAKEVCVEIFLKAADKFVVTFNSGRCRCDDALFDTYLWVADNIDIIKLFNKCDPTQMDYNAIVQCGESIRESIKTELYKQLTEAVTDNIDDSVHDIHVLNIESGLVVFYPVGEVYGLSYDYVDAVKISFCDLKKKYDAIGIRGLVYYYETVSFGTTGAYFYCEPGDEALTVSYEWQKCIECGRILVKDALYNSNQWDKGEGTEFCLCSPTCMLAYTMSDNCHMNGYVGVNRRLRERFPDRDIYWDDCWIKNEMWNEIRDHFDEYSKDFLSKQTKIVELEKNCFNKARWDCFAKTAEEHGLTQLLGIKETIGDADDIFEFFANRSFAFLGTGLQWKAKKELELNIERLGGIIVENSFIEYWGVDYFIVPDKPLSKTGRNTIRQVVNKTGHEPSLITIRELREKLETMAKQLF